MKTIFIRILFAMIIVLSYSCSSDSEDTLMPLSQNKITYTQNVKPIIDSNCIVCHNNPPVNGAPFSLLTYGDVSSRASQVLTAISRQNGEARAMPPSGRLSQSTIDIIDQWISDGLLEN